MFTHPLIFKEHVAFTNGSESAVIKKNCIKTKLNIKVKRIGIKKNHLEEVYHNLLIRELIV